ncbi:MAG: hypothetical protein ACD_10C00370G0001 [uncultured bacterium]|nr:MAG: hypothetical protein ACD_10C00370G0001 [uncultured bacterium]
MRLALGGGLIMARQALANDGGGLAVAINVGFQQRQVFFRLTVQRRQAGSRVEAGLAGKLFDQCRRVIGWVSNAVGWGD